MMYGFLTVVFMIAAALMGGGIGYDYATRNNDVLVKWIEVDRSTQKAIADFSKLIKETDWCGQ